MTIELTPEESEEIFFNSLCNGHGLANCGLSIETSEEDYKKAKLRLLPSIEDVWMEVLRGGGKLTLVDDENGEEPAHITLKEVHERVQTAPVNHLMDAINEEDDATTAEVILQQVFYQDVIFG